MSEVYGGPAGAREDDNDVGCSQMYQKLRGWDQVPRKAATLKCDTSSLDKYDWVEDDIRNMIGWLDKYCTLNVDAERLGALWYEYFWNNDYFYMRRQNNPGWVKPTADDMEDFAKWLSEQDV